jgi:hypothetical protein
MITCSVILKSGVNNKLLGQLHLAQDARIKSVSVFAYLLDWHCCIGILKHHYSVTNFADLLVCDRLISYPTYNQGYKLPSKGMGHQVGNPWFLPPFWHPSWIAPGQLMVGRYPMIQKNKDLPWGQKWCGSGSGTWMGTITLGHCEISIDM